MLCRASKARKESEECDEGSIDFGEIIERSDVKERRDVKEKI